MAYKLNPITGKFDYFELGISEILGTPNQVNVSEVDGSVTLSLPQNIHAGATPTFYGMNLAGGAFTMTPLMDQTPVPFRIAPDFNGQYYATTEFNAFQIDGANMQYYGSYTGPTVRMFDIKDVTGAHSFAINQYGIPIADMRMNNRGVGFLMYANGDNAYYAGDSDGLHIAGINIGTYGIYSGGNLRYFRISSDLYGECVAVDMYGRTGLGTYSPQARLDVNGGSIFRGGLNITDGVNIALATTTGTKIGTATSQKLSFWNVTPIVQPTTAIAAASFVANTSGIADDTATFDGYTIGQVVTALRNIGLLN